MSCFQKCVVSGIKYSINALNFVHYKMIIFSDIYFAVNLLRTGLTAIISQKVCKGNFCFWVFYIEIMGVFLISALQFSFLYPISTYCKF